MTRIKDFFQEHDTLTFVLVFTLVAVAIIAISGVLVGLANHATCEAQTSTMFYAHTWSFWGGCKIQTPDSGWIPLENWHYWGNLW